MNDFLFFGSIVALCAYLGLKAGRYVAMQMEGICKCKVNDTKEMMVQANDPDGQPVMRSANIPRARVYSNVLGTQVCNICGLTWPQPFRVVSHCVKLFINFSQTHNTPLSLSFSMSSSSSSSSIDGRT